MGYAIDGLAIDRLAPIDLPAGGGLATKKREGEPRAFLNRLNRRYSPTAAARSDFSTMRADLPRRLRR
jgi:hypothetical protein